MYHTIISIANLCSAWEEFVSGKMSKKDVAEFSLHFSQNIFKLHEELKNKTYYHAGYTAFSINDPKPRNIHKSTVRDRLMHHAIYAVLYPFFDQKFIYDSYSCRNMKGTHRTLNRFKLFSMKVSRNNHRTCLILKCDIRKFFASIDQKILIEIVQRHISEPDVIGLIQNVVSSFHSTSQGKGLPLGNLTSQLLVNIYMNEFDQYMKHELKVKYYIRYADDFVIMSEDKEYLQNTLRVIGEYLGAKLKLSLHPDKVFIKPLASGVDFLGWVHFPHHPVLRTSTKKRMIRNLVGIPKPARIASYKGMLRHGNTFKLQQKLFKYDTVVK